SVGSRTLKVPAIINMGTVSASGGALNITGQNGLSVSSSSGTGTYSGSSVSFTATNGALSFSGTSNMNATGTNLVALGTNGAVNVAPSATITAQNALNVQTGNLVNQGLLASSNA